MCLACEGPVPEGRADWCSRSCRAALRRYGSDLDPAASRRDQLERALAARRTLREVGIGLDATYRARPQRLP